MLLERSLPLYYASSARGSRSAGVRVLRYYHGGRRSQSMAAAASVADVRHPQPPPFPIQSDTPQLPRVGQSLKPDSAPSPPDAERVVADTPRDKYHELVAHGTLREDSHQERIIDKLQVLHNRLISYNPPIIQPPSHLLSLVGRLFHLQPQPQYTHPMAPRGLYLFGDVGTGKSMLMDLFYNTAPPSITRKRRVHFHAFMIDVHKRIHALKTHPSTVAEDGGDPIRPVARDIANEATLLCFDEFQVADIVDAMILRRLLECLLEFGVVCVMTSNRHPDDLYKNGLQRESFIPCIQLIKRRFDVMDLDSETDYRRVPRALAHVYYFPLSEANRIELDKIFDAVTEHEPITRNRALSIWGRPLVVPVSTTKVARFTFAQLCGNPMSAADYVELTRVFNTIFVLDVPKMNLDHKDMARRFITFVDACYENKTKLFISSEVPIYQIFSDDKAGPPSEHMKRLLAHLGLKSDLIAPSPLFTGEEEIFAFARACSRLVHMGTREWAEAVKDS